MQERRQPETIGGRVNADGSIAGGDGFMVTRSSTGTYVITFPAGFRTISMTANYAVWESGGSVIVDSIGNLAVGNGGRVLTFSTAGGGVDKAFAFTAVGVQT